MNGLSEQRQEEPAKWERVYVQAINVLFVVAGAFLIWNVFSTSDWRTRSGCIFIVAWTITLRLGARLIPTSFMARVQNWRAARRLHEFGFGLLRIGTPFSVFGYLVRWRSPWELVTMILIMSLLPLFFWGPDRSVPPHDHE